MSKMWLLMCVLVVGPLFVASAPGNKAIPWKSNNIREATDSNGQPILIRRREVGEESEALSRQARCECMCRARFRPDNWECCTCTWTQEICFPGDATVLTPQGEVIPMTNLRVGTQVLTANEDGSVETTEVVSFLKRNPTGMGVYIILNMSTGHQMELSPSHLVFAANTNNTADFKAMFAKDVEIGDHVMVQQGPAMATSRVINKQLDVMEGVYVPLTSHGTLLVNGVYASCYASFNHQLAHIAMTPMRWCPWLMDLGISQAGEPLFVAVIKGLGHFALPQGIQDESPYWQTIGHNFASWFP